MTASEVISQAYKACGSLALGQNMTNEQAADGLFTLKNMISMWSIQKLFIPYTIDETLTLVASQATYTWGTGGNFTTTRPARIMSASIRIGETDYPIKIISKEEYQRITDKLTTGRPEKMVYEPTFSLASVILYPVPDSAYSFLTSSWKPLTNVTDISTVITFPDEYNEPLISNLACLLAIGSGIPLDPDLKTRAASGVRILKNHNAQPIPTATYDSAILTTLRK